MEVFKNRCRQDWNELIKRPEIEKESLNQLVQGVLDNVKRNKDAALIKYAKEFDKVTIIQLAVSNKEIDNAISVVSDELKAAINLAKGNIEKFHSSQITNEQIIETTKGVECWRKFVGGEYV